MKHLTLHLSGVEDLDLLLGLEEVARQLRKGRTAGRTTNRDGAYAFSTQNSMVVRPPWRGRKRSGFPPSDRAQLLQMVKDMRATLHAFWPDGKRIPKPEDPAWPSVKVALEESKKLIRRLEKGQA